MPRGPQHGAVVVTNTNAAGTITISRYVNAGAAWVCVQAPLGVDYRVKLTVPVATTPNVETVLTTPPPQPPPPKPWPNKASNRCQASTGTFLVNYQVLDTQLWLANRSIGTTADVCVREELAGGGAGLGGVVTIAPTNLPVVFGSSDDLSPCTQVVNHLEAPPLKLFIDKSPSMNPQSVCIDAGLYRQRVFVGTPPGGGLVTFTPDT